MMLLLNVLVLATPPTSNCSAQCTGAALPLNATMANVLLLGDSISANGSGYFINVKSMLEEYGTAAVQHTGAYGKGICGTSFGVLACWDLWSGVRTRTLLFLCFVSARYVCC